MADSNFMLPSGQDVFPFSQSYSGIGTGNSQKLMNSVIPQLTNSINNMPANIDSYFNNSMSAYGQQLQDALKNNIPKTVNNLANRGILNSTVASDSIANTQKAAYQDFNDKGYQAALQTALLKSQMPQLLTNIAGLGNYSSGYTEDKTQLYQTLASMLMSQM